MVLLVGLNGLDEDILTDGALSRVMSNKFVFGKYSSSFHMNVKC